MIDPYVQALVSRMRNWSMPMSSEAKLQSFMGNLLESMGPQFPFVREHRLGPGERIDFLVRGEIGIEAKVKYPRRQIWRQLERYAAHHEIKFLVLVTGTAMGLPPTIGGKPLYYVSLGRSGL